MREPIGKLASEWTIVHGLSIHAHVSINPVPAEAPAIIMVHGLVVSSRYMIPTALQLAPYYHIYALDLPGFGKSDKPSHVLNIAELADFLADWMQAIGLKQATLLGNSLGCQVIANLALRHPEHISQIMLLGPTTDPRARTAYQLMVRWLLNATREPLSLFPIVIRDYLDAGFRRFVWTFRYMLQDRIEKHLPHVSHPGLVVRGSDDPVAPQRWAEEATRLLPDGQLVVIARATHDITYGSPVQLTRVVRAFLNVDRAEDHDPASSTAIPVLAPVQGQIQLTVNQDMASCCDVAEKDANLTILDLPGDSTLLQPHASRLGTSLGKTADHSMTEMVDSWPSCSWA